ncbi:MAG: alpha/beta hydrolase [Myxococcales bacterium]|nr:alpha/beta hydrolase [Myxococcales bacterium]MDP3504533.1 alpha/beta hydrolase [Myxococcales bacterium]
MTRALRWVNPLTCALSWAALVFGNGDASNGGGMVATGYLDVLVLTYASSAVVLGVMALIRHAGGPRWPLMLASLLLIAALATMTWQYRSARTLNLAACLVLITGTVLAAREREQGRTGVLRPTWRLLNWFASLLDKPIETIGPTRSRAAMRKNTGSFRPLFGLPAEVARVVDEHIADVPVRRYEPTGVQPGLIVYFHGGGWVVGDVVTHDLPCRALAAQTKRTVISVDYRLAPEHPFPAAIDDALAVTTELAKAHRVVVAGDSAGGHLAAVMARKCPSLAGQVLVYPVTDCAEESPSYTRYGEGFFLTRATMRYFRDTFLPDPASRSHEDASPLRGASSKTAPAYVLLAECDVLHDEGLAYAKKLEAEGTVVTVDEVSGVIHGFFSMQGMAASREATERVTSWIRKQFS